MAEDLEKTEMVEPVAPEQKPEADTTEMGKDPQTELSDIRNALKKANAEAAKYRKLAEAIEAEKKAKAEADMTELEKATQKLKELETKTKAYEVGQLKAEVAKTIGLPEELKEWLHGETKEEIEENAKALLEALPKAKPAQNVTNTRQQATGAETDAQKRARLGLIQNWNAFDADVMKTQGGGVVFGG